MDDGKGPRPEGYWRARVSGEPCFVRLIRETYGDGSYSEAVDARLAGYGWITEHEKHWGDVELLEPADPALPSGGDEATIRAALRARGPAGASPALEPGKPHPSHEWVGDGSVVNRENPVPVPHCSRCLALANEPPGWAPCRKADGGAKMAEAVAALTAPDAKAPTLAELGASVPMPPPGGHRLGAVGEPGRLGCDLCGRFASDPRYDAEPCPANPR